MKTVHTALAVIRATGQAITEDARRRETIARLAKKTGRPIVDVARDYDSSVTPAVRVSL